MKRKICKTLWRFLKKEYILLILILIISLSLIEPIKHAYNKKFDLAQITNNFEHSKYKKNIIEIEEHPDTMPKDFQFFDSYTPSRNFTMMHMRDSDLYAYKSYQYINGIISPLTALGIGHGNMPCIPIGLSILIFKTQYMATIITSLLCLYLVYMLSQSLFKNRNFSIIIVGLLCLDSAFKFHFQNVLLDLYLAVFILLSFYFSFKIIDKKNSKKNYFLLALSLGGAISTKLLIGALLTATILAYFLIKNLQYFKRILKYTPFSFLIYIATEWHALVFLKRLAFFYKAIPFHMIKGLAIIRTFGIGREPASAPPFIKMFFTGKWKNMATNKIVNVYSFQPIITILSITSLLSIYYILKDKKRRDKLILLWIWLVVYCVALASRHAFPWYLTEILPIMYILACYTCCNFIKSLKYFSKQIG